MFRRFILPAAAVAVLLSAPAFAQPAPAADLAPPARAAHRLQEFHDRLGITAAQQPQWDAVMAALHDNAAARQAHPAPADTHLNGVEALHVAADRARERADALQHVIPPVEALYAALTPEQRTTFDRTVDRMMHQRGPHRG